MVHAMKRKAGFTIIELVIALSIIFFISAIAIPTYNNLILKQADIAQADQVVACLKQAESYAVALPVQYVADDIHFVEVSITNNNNNQDSVCQIIFNDSNDHPVSASLPSYSMSSIRLTSSSNVTLFFDVTKKGLPIKSLNDPSLLSSSQKYDFTDSSQNTSLSVSMGITGLPITVAVN
jgi:prepilin-type N-terminal cleavage/methylation domain-containing protein